jgi:hypothetical protein
MLPPKRRMSFDPSTACLAGVPAKQTPLAFDRKKPYRPDMAEQNVVIPKPVLDSVETLDELQDWQTANNPRIVAELRDARREDPAGEFKPWRPRHLPCPPSSSK